MILRSALGGDIWQQWQLFSLMLDTWPMLRKCSQELRSAVAQTKFVVRPFAVHGQEPTPKAIEKSDFCSNALQTMKPDPFTDEKGFSGLIYDITDAFINGIVLSEILWNADTIEWLPRATAWIHPRHYSFTNGGRIVVFAGNAQGGYAQAEFPDPDKFIIGQYQGKSGSCLGAGMFRPLAWDWSAVMYNREWMLEFAQRFGQPFRVAKHKIGTPESEIQIINTMMANIGSAGWANLKEGTEVTFEPPGTLGPQNPHVSILDRADEDCQVLILGQTSSTQGTAGKLGNEEQREGVRKERVKEVSLWVGQVLSAQLLPAICRLNYGNEDECPVCEPDFSEVIDPIKTAQRWQVIVSTGVPVSYEEFCHENGLVTPQPGDLIFFNNRVGKMGSTDEEIDVSGQQADMLASLMNLGGADDQSNGNQTNGHSVRARSHKLRLGALLEKARPLLAKAAAKDLALIRAAVQEVLDATDEHFDRACQQLRAKLADLASREPTHTAKVLNESMTAAWFNGVGKRKTTIKVQ